MIIAGIWALPAIRSVNPDAKIAVAPLPVWEGTERNTILYSWSWFVGNQSSEEEQAAAWKLTNFLSAAGQALVGRLRFHPGAQCGRRGGRRYCCLSRGDRAGASGFQQRLRRGKLYVPLDAFL